MSIQLAPMRGKSSGRVTAPENPANLDLLPWARRVNASCLDIRHAQVFLAYLNSKGEKQLSQDDAAAAIELLTVLGPSSTTAREIAETLCLKTDSFKRVMEWHAYYRIHARISTPVSQCIAERLRGLAASAEDKRFAENLD
jgi:hypothetical protein